MTNTSDFGRSAATAPIARAEAPHPSGADLSERDLLERAQGGDREAVDRLLAAARPRLCAVALKMVRDRDEAEDVVQEAMLKAWRHVGRFEGRAALSTWLHRIVVNTAVDRLRSRRHGITSSGSSQDVPDEEQRTTEVVHAETPEDLLARAQTSAVVLGAIRRLSPVHQEVLSLRELEGESYQSIADIARCPVGTVMSRLHHARHRLAQTLASEHSGLLSRAA
jgi:RNA polymerase sigma-70 factor (ECF subfamily)